MRLLILTIVVSAAVLLLLARLRFPEPPPTVDTSAQPLERLAARASFEELATRVARLEASIAANLVVLRLAPRVESGPVRFRDVTSADPASHGGVRHVPALRIDGTAAVAAIPANVRITGIVGPMEPTDTAGIVTTDPVRHIARIRVPEGPARALPQLALAVLQTPTYVVAVEGTRAGLTLRPVFLGRSDRFGSPRWTRPLLPLGGTSVTPGALMFTLDGEFLGCAVVEDGTLAIVGAADVLDVFERTRGGAAPPVDPGIAVQAMSATVAQASGAASGAVVAEVEEHGPAAGALEAGDVITELGGAPVSEPESLLIDLGTRLAEGPVQVTVVRQQQRRTVDIGLLPDARRASAGDRGTEATLQFVRGAGTRVTAVGERSAFAAAGVTAGDIIVRVGGLAAPTPAQVRTTLRNAPTGSFVMLVLKRGDIQHVTAVRSQGPGDVTAR
jgi:hypothetical protein